MICYKHYLGDYARDTKGLSVTEHGAYRLLLDHNYATEQPIPNELKELYRIVGAQTPAERKAVERVAEKFFPVNGDGRRHNRRAQEEIGKYQQQVEHNRAVGQRGGRPRKKPGDNPDGNPDGNPEETRTVTRSEPGGEPGNNPSHSHKPEKAKAKGSDDPSSEPAVHDCPHESLLALYAKHLPTLTQPRLWDGQRAELMRTRWRACAKKNAVWPGYRTAEEGLEFWDKFFAGVAESRTLTEGIKRPDGSAWKPDLPWLLKAENFAKVIEGRYHQ